MTLSRDVIETVGYPSAEFFIWHDDGEYCERIRNNGFKIYVLTGIRYVHLFPPSTLHYFYSKRWVYNIRNQLLMYLKRWNKSSVKNMFVGLLRIWFRIFMLNILIFSYAFFVREKSQYIINSLKAMLLACFKKFGKIEESSRSLKRYTLLGRKISKEDVYKHHYDLLLMPNFTNSYINFVNLDKIKCAKVESISSKLFSNISSLKYGLYLLKFYVFSSISRFNKNILALEFEAPNIITAKRVVTYDIFEKSFMETNINSVFATMYYIVSVISSLYLSMILLLLCSINEIVHPYNKRLQNWIAKELLKLNIHIF